jgi:hypothetical protein
MDSVKAHEYKYRSTHMAVGTSSCWKLTWLGFESTIVVYTCVCVRTHYTTLTIGTSSCSAMMMEITERNPEIKVALYLCTLWRSSMLRLHEETQMMKQTNEQGQRCCCTYTENNTILVVTSPNAFCFLYKSDKITP